MATWATPAAALPCFALGTHREPSTAPFSEWLPTQDSGKLLPVAWGSNTVGRNGDASIECF